MRKQGKETPTFLTALCCGSLLTEKLKELIVLLSQQFSPSDREKTWAIFPGTGTEGNYYDAFVGLFSGEIGNNNCYAMAAKITRWINNRTQEIDGPIIVVMVTYSRGGVTANLACQQINDDRVKIILINIDPVPGMLAHRGMLPPIASNVIKHIVLYAKFAIMPLHLCFLPHQFQYQNPHTEKIIHGIDLDHAGIGANRITHPLSADEFFLTRCDTAKLMVPLLIVGLQNIGVPLRNATDTLKEQMIQEWINWYLEKNKLWQSTFLHGENGIRKHQHEAPLFRLAIALIFIASAAPWISSPHRYIFLSMISCILITTLYAIYAMVKPIDSIATSLISKEAISPGKIRESLENFIARFQMTEPTKVNATVPSL